MYTSDDIVRPRWLRRDVRLSMFHNDRGHRNSILGCLKLQGTAVCEVCRAAGEFLEGRAGILSRLEFTQHSDGNGICASHGISLKDTHSKEIVMTTRLMKTLPIYREISSSYSSCLTGQTSQTWADRLLLGLCDRSKDPKQCIVNNVCRWSTSIFTR